MRCEPSGLPLSESLGVFLGVLGLQWLIDGQADILLALGLALATAVLILILRRLQRRKEE